MDARLILAFVACIVGANAQEMTGQFGSPVLEKLRQNLEKGAGDFPILQNLYRELGADSDTPILDKIRETGPSRGFPVLRRIAQHFPGLIPTLMGAGIHCRAGSVKCGKSITRHVYLGPGAFGLLPTLEDKAMQIRDRQFGPVVCAPGADACGVSLTYNVHPGKITRSNVGVGNDDRTYVFAMHLSALDTKGMDSIDDLYDHYQEGHFHKEFILAVCAEAGKKCKGIYDDSFNCFKSGEGSGPVAGVGLLARNYDACVSWAKTPHRESIVGFTEPHFRLKAPNTEGKFYVKEGNPSAFDPTDMATATKIGVINTFFHGAYKGIKQNPNIKGTLLALRRDHVKVVSTKRELWRVILRGEVTAGFAPYKLMDLMDHPGVVSIGDSIDCAMNDDGTTEVAMMVRKDSTLPDWWNSAFERIKHNGQFYSLCSKYEHVAGICAL
ncbi:uncharacterized protein LOC102802050 [Saccoglossus kowalevskii]|uniref:Uncharacterized protein LOC102802050 n=1 Tax=Saccoglossus kowalevskii TaxID=10224 RepID=A0ABM0M3E2_SACKO|nr:PREDICTED: uncharacterized protein LOC102802050 [Saccoglossus kowalevskii]